MLARAHFEHAQPQEIDFVGVRFPDSVEHTIESVEEFSSFVFKDDGKILGLSEEPEITFLIAEVTRSETGREIKERIDKLRNITRIRYALRRLGVIRQENIERLMREKPIIYKGCIRTRLIRVMVVLTEKVASKYQQKNNDIIFIPRG